MACVPTGNPLLVIDAEPPETVAAVPSAVDPSKSCTCPVGVPPATETVNAKVLPGPDATFVGAVTVRCVTVVTGPPPPPPPPQPSAKLSKHIRPSPSAARYFFLPGRNSSSIAASPVPALSVHQPL